MSYLSETGHGLAGDDLIAAEAGDETQGLVLVLPSFQLAQDQRSEYLHFLQGTRDVDHQKKRPLHEQHRGAFSGG